MTNQTTIVNNTQPLKGFPANFLKIFAALTMLIDHAALTLVYAKLSEFPEYRDIIFSAEAAAEEIAAIPANYLSIYSMYTVMRLVGRIAFPLYAFLLVEGFLHTSDIKRYLFRVGLCALVAEIPFNLVVTTAAPALKIQNVTASVFCPQYQNTVFTLFLALLMLCAMKHFETSQTNPRGAVKQLLGQFFSVMLACLLAILLRTDYSYIGILLIAVFYYFRGSRKMQVILGCILFLGINVASLLAFIPIGMYNGILLRSKKCKYFFYIFYPAHLLVLYLLSLLI
ncbi:MAG: TraX family protein [Lachnospiraceae bacterium]|nr:TraX family protein [Lachnospiraceae bacterium]